MPHQQHFDSGFGRGLDEGAVENGDTVVVSVGLSNVIRRSGIGRRKLVTAVKENESDEDDEEEEEDEEEDQTSDEEDHEQREEPSDAPEAELSLGPGKIYPLDSFTLDIFVFNKSERTRRFEMSCFERRRRRRGVDSSTEGADADGFGTARKMGYPGIMPMEGRVRIG
jgi:hypothetical protein